MLFGFINCGAISSAGQSVPFTSGRSSVQIGYRPQKGKVLKALQKAQPTYKDLNCTREGAIFIFK